MPCPDYQIDAVEMIRLFNAAADDLVGMRCVHAWPLLFEEGITGP